MDATTTAQLASCRASITNLEAALASGGDATQEYFIGGRKWRRGDIDRQLAVLYTREKDLLERSNRPSRPSVAVAGLRRPPGAY